MRWSRHGVLLGICVAACADPGGSASMAGDAGPTSQSGGATTDGGSASQTGSATAADSGSGGPELPVGGCFGPGQVPPTVGPSGIAVPSVEDERAAYASFGWSWAPEAEPDAPAEEGYAIVNPDIHGTTEGDDLWSYLMMYQRTGQQGYLDRASEWARYFKEDFVACAGDMGRTFCSDRDQFGADHLYGWGLIAWAEAMDDPAALDAAIAIGVELEAVRGPDTTFGCIHDDGCLRSGARQIARHLLFATRLAEATGDPRWETLRDSIIDTLLTSPHWDAELGCYVLGENRTDETVGPGAYAAGARIATPFHLGILSEAMDQAYRVTGNETLRARMVAMAGFVDRFGLDETYDYTGSKFGVFDGRPYHNYAAQDPVDFWDTTNTTALVNILVRGFRYTCDEHFLERAVYFFERGNKGIPGEPIERAAPDGVVHHFVDSRFDSSTGFRFLAFNKGELQYTYLLFAGE